MFKFTNLVMLLAPIGVFGAIAYTVGHLGLGVLMPLLRLLAHNVCRSYVFILAVLLPIAVIVGVPIRRFLRAAAEPVTIAFATASSEAALPRAMEEMEDPGRAARHRRLRPSHRLQLQFGRLESLSIARV